MLDEKGVIEGKVVVEGLTDGSIVASFHLVEGVDIIGDVGGWGSIEADFIVVCYSHFGKSDVLLDGLSDVVGVEDDRCNFVCDDALLIVPIGHGEVELGVVDL
jgi:hypothetical protein